MEHDALIVVAKIICTFCDIIQKLLLFLAVSTHRLMGMNISDGLNAVMHKGAFIL